MGGTVELRSDIGLGSVIAARVPLTKLEPLEDSATTPRTHQSPPEASNTEEIGPELLPELRRENFRILLADDNDLIREIICKILTKMQVSFLSSADRSLSLTRTVHRKVLCRDCL